MKKKIEASPPEEKNYSSKALDKKWNLFKRPEFLELASASLLSEVHKTLEPTSP